MPPPSRLSKSPDFRASVLQSLAQSNPDLVVRAQQAIIVNAAKQAYAEHTSTKSTPVVLRSESSGGRATRNHHKFDQLDDDSPISEREMQRHYVPTKRQSKGKSKLSKGTSNWFNAAALKGVPGASNNSSYASIAQMYEESTGCLVIDDAAEDENRAVTSLKERLERSARNCDTTKGNYILTYVHSNKVEETGE